MNSKIIRNCIFALLAIFLTASAFISGKIRDGRTPINSDAAGYYCYLPAIFIYGDIHCGFLKQGSELANHYQQEYGYPPEIWFLNNTEKGEITKYSCGTALCERCRSSLVQEFAKPRCRRSDS